MVLAPYVQLGIPNAGQVRTARKSACWLPQEHTQVYPLHTPSRITFLSCFPATGTWDQPLLVQGHQNRGQRRCLPPCQILQETQQGQIPTFSWKQTQYKKGCTSFIWTVVWGTDWYLHGDNKKKERRPLSFSKQNFDKQFCHLNRKTVPSRKRSIFNSFLSLKCFGFPSWIHLILSIGSFHYNKRERVTVESIPLAKSNRTQPSTLKSCCKSCLMLTTQGFPCPII